MSADTLVTVSELAFCQLYAYVSQSFRYPTPATSEFLNDAVVIQGIDEAAAELRESAPEKILPVGPQLQLEREYIRIFGHTITGPVPLYELEYGEGQVAQQTYILSELAGFYSAFGFRLNPGYDERVDHISVQSEYLSLMAYREAHARGRGHDDGLAVCLDAHKKYLRDHLARWGFSFASRVESLAVEGHYARAARLLTRLLRADCARLEVPEGRPDLVVRVPEPLPSDKCGDLKPSEDQEC